jgi:glycosyltransferase involved in cell wall biosynthesis
VLTFHSVTWHSYADLVLRGELKGPLSDYLGAKTVPYGWNLPSWYMWAQIRRARHIFTPSDFCRHEVIRFLHVSPERVTTTPLAVHEQFELPPRSAGERMATLQKLGIRKPFLLYVGGYEPHKNVGGLLETFALVRARRPDLSLVLVGSKSLPAEVRAQAKELGLTEGADLAFLLNLTTELTDLYDEAELFVTMSWRESFCLPALEAMTRGLPVVASRWGASPEVVGDAGVLVDPRDPAAAAAVISEQLSRPDREELRAIARQRSRAFNWQRTAAQTIEVYQKLIKR